MKTLSVKETALLLGVHVGTVYRWCGRQRNPLPHVWERGHIQIRREDALAYRRPRGGRPRKEN